MNEKVLTFAVMLTLITIGINGALAMGGQLLDEDGSSILIYTGLENNQIIDLQNKTFDTNSDCGDASADTPTATEGCSPITITQPDGTPQRAGLDPLSTIAVMVSGVQLILLYFSNTYPFLAPMTTAVFIVVTTIQMFVVAYVGSLMIRSIFGRLR